MQCQNTGPEYLGISEEACSNAGGRWFRSNCDTLKSCIDHRPSRFDLDAPVNGDCQDSLKQWNTAYVKMEGALSKVTQKVKVQLRGNNYLHIEELQVFDSNGVSRAFNKNATQSSSYSDYLASDAVRSNVTYSHKLEQTGKYTQLFAIFQNFRVYPFLTSSDPT